MSSYNNTGALASPLPSPPGPAPSTVTMPIQNTALDTPATVTTGGSTSAQSATRKSTRARKSAPSMPAGDSQASATVPATSVRRSTRRASAAATCRISSQMNEGRRLKKTFKVEDIIDRRKAGRSMEYLVKWAGWPASHNTWEPRRNLGNCLGLIRKCNAALNEAEKAKK